MPVITPLRVIPPKVAKMALHGITKPEPLPISQLEDPELADHLRDYR